MPLARRGIQLAGVALAIVVSPASLALAAASPGPSASPTASPAASLSPSASPSPDPSARPGPSGSAGATPSARPSASGSSTPLPASTSSWLDPSGAAHTTAVTGRARPAAGRARIAGPPKTVVTFAWGGGLADQMPSLPLFRKYGMHATYFVASGLVCQLRQQQCQKTSPYLTISDIHKIAAAGNEIGGLSVLHEQLTTMPVAEAKREVCDDRVNLFRWGFRPTDFAYPFAAVNPAVETLTRQCGYDAGLGTGTLRAAGRCLTCAWAESIPPKDPLNVRTPVEVNSVNTTWTAATYESDIREAQLHGGGWVIFTIHDICPATCLLGTTPAILGSVLGWLHGQQGHHILVETMAHVIHGPVLPAVAGPVPGARSGNGVANASLAARAGRLPACFQAADYGTTAASFSYRPGAGRQGAAAETVRTTRQGSGNAKLLETMDLGRCAPPVAAGHAYSAGLWYRATRQSKLELYRRTALGSWVYWTTSPGFPASRSWRQAAWKTPVVPPGTTALSFGLAATSAGTITTTDYSLKVVKSYRNAIWLGVLVLAVLAAGLIARGHYRYTRYVKAEAVEMERAEIRS